MNGTQLLADKVAVVTGASSGNGRAIARDFAFHGANVVIADIREAPREGGTPTHELINEETDRQARYVDCDVTDVEQLRQAIDVADELGGLDVWVNNAGVFRAEKFLEVTEEDYDWLMDINVKGSFFGAQQAAKRMIETGGGSIINLSSVAGIQGSGQYVTYCTSKGAIRLMTYSLAATLGPDGVRINSIHPGVIETAMTTEDVEIIGTEAGEGFLEQIPSRRFGQPEDVADIAVFLASDLADYVNGESIIVDGGMTNTM